MWAALGISWEMVHKAADYNVEDSQPTVSEVDPFVEATSAPLCYCQSTETEEDAWMIACNNEACVYTSGFTILVLD